MISGPTQLLMRSASVIHKSPLLVIDAPKGDLLSQILPAGDQRNVTCIQTNYGDYLAATTYAQQHDTADESVHVLFQAAIDQPVSPYANAVLYLPRERELREWLLLAATRSLAPTGVLHAVGYVRSGAKSAAKLLRRFFGCVERVDSARHCVLYAASCPNPDLAAGDACRIPLQTYTATIGDQKLDLCSLPGVFSHGRLDDGTRLLLETFTDTPSAQGRLLDFGCGCGAVGVFLHIALGQVEVDMIDVSAMAIEAAKKTVELNNLARCTVQPSDGFSNVNGRYDWIVSNPPFHTGVKTDYGIVERFFDEARSHLKIGGRLRIVGNRFLKYAESLENRMGNCRTLADDGRYRVYEARKTAGGNRV